MTHTPPPPVHHHHLSLKVTHYDTGPYIVTFPPFAKHHRLSESAALLDYVIRRQYHRTKSPMEGYKRQHIGRNF